MYSLFHLWLLLGNKMYVKLTLLFFFPFSYGINTVWRAGDSNKVSQPILVPSWIDDVIP